MVELLVTGENLHSNIYSGSKSNQIDIFFKKKKKRAVETSTIKLPAFQKLRGRSRQEARWESLELFSEQQCSDSSDSC